MSKFEFVDIPTDRRKRKRSDYGDLIDALWIGFKEKKAVVVPIPDGVKQQLFRMKIKSMLTRMGIFTHSSVSEEFLYVWINAAKTKVQQ